MTGAAGARGSRPARGVAVLLAMAAGAALAGCSGATTHVRAAATSVRVAGTTGGPNACVQDLRPGTTTLHLTIDGRDRTVIVHVPPAAATTVNLPLVLDLHGSESDASQQEALSGMDAVADRDGFVVAYPQALIAAKTGFDWNVPNEPLVGGAQPPAGAPDDVAFLTALVPALGQRMCIDPKRVYATGISGGGRMASQLACDAAGTFAAVAPVAGLRLPSPCPGTRPVPVVAFHGTADPVDPYGGSGQGYWTYSVPAAEQRWSAHNHCSATPSTTSGTGYTLTTYPGCAGGAQVELYTLAGEGHEWPGGPTLPKAITKVLGPQSNAVNADDTMWTFFTAHPMP